MPQINEYSWIFSFFKILLIILFVMFFLNFIFLNYLNFSFKVQKMKFYKILI